MIDIEKSYGTRHDLKIDPSYTVETVKVKTLGNCKYAQAAPMGKSHRVSLDAVWPLRGADGLTFAERKAKEQEQSK